MENHKVTSNLAISPADFKEKIYEKLVKAKAVLTCIMFAAEFLRDDKILDNTTIYHTLWVVDEYLDDLIKLQNF